MDGPTVRVPIYESSFAVAIMDTPLFVEQARKISHDAVIRSTGRARRSGVQWTHEQLKDWRTVLDGLGIAAPADRERAGNDIENLAGLYPFGILVIATVEVDPAVDP